MSNPEFKSVFKAEFQELIQLKRALGFKYEAQAMAFGRIDSFFVNNNIKEKEISRELCDKWCRKRSHESDSNHAHRVSRLRVFCRYLNDIGIPVHTPPPGITNKRKKYDAHIYTKDELQRFFKAVDASKSIPSECPYRGLVMPIFFRILYTSGMRVSELRLLKIKNVNLDEGCVKVTGGKNQKDRIVPIHPSLVKKCIELRDTIHMTSSEEEFFFMIRPGQAMPLVNVYHNFRRYLEKADIPHTGRGPRVHDFRFTYCVNLLLKWANEDKDLMTYLPYMRTILGHEGFKETAYYLKLTAEAYPLVRTHLEQAFPNVIEEACFNEREFY